jgi:hypothetical protein
LYLDIPLAQFISAFAVAIFSPRQANLMASEAHPGERELTVNARRRYPDQFAPAGISYVGLSRINADVQLDLGFANIAEMVEALQAADGLAPNVDVTVAFSAFLTPGAFLQLHREVNRFYEILTTQGFLSLPE